jgi:hypothetical protein
LESKKKPEAQQMVAWPEFETVSFGLHACDIMDTPTSSIWEETIVAYVSRKLNLVPSSCWFLAWLILRPWRWRRHIPPKRQLTFSWPQGVYLGRWDSSNVDFGSYNYEFVP